MNGLQALKQFESYQQNILGRSENTIRNYKADILAFAKWYESDILNADKAQLEKYLMVLSENGLSPATRSRKVTALQMFFGYCLDEDIISENPARSLKKPKIPQKKVKAMSKEEIKSVLEAAEKAKKNIDYFRNLVLINLFYATGLRRNEIINVKLNDIDLKENSLLVMEGKGDKQRIVYFNDTVKALLSEYISSHRNLLKYASESDYLFPSNCSEKMSVGTVNNIVNAIYEEAGVKEKGYVVHSTRKAFATTVYDNTHDIAVVQNLLGHSSPETTMRYIGIEEETKRNAAKMVEF